MTELRLPALLLLAARDRHLGGSRAETQAARADLPTPAVAPGTDAWQQGPTGQLHNHRSEHAEQGLNASSNRP